MLMDKAGTTSSVVIDLLGQRLDVHGTLLLQPHYCEGMRRNKTFELRNGWLSLQDPLATVRIQHYGSVVLRDLTISRRGRSEAASLLAIEGCGRTCMISVCMEGPYACPDFFTVVQCAAVCVGGGRPALAGLSMFNCRLAHAAGHGIVGLHLQNLRCLRICDLCVEDWVADRGTALKCQGCAGGILDRVCSHGLGPGGIAGSFDEACARIVVFNSPTNTIWVVPPSSTIRIIEDLFCYASTKP
jgi:hypothetical protein